MEDIFAAIDTVGILVTGLATVALAALTYVLAKENRMLREAGSSPQVVAYLAPHPDGNGGVNFIVANIGNGPAFAISIRFDHDAKDFEEHQVLLGNNSERSPLSILPPGEKIASLFGIGPTLFRGRAEEGPKALKSFKVQVEYLNINGRKVVSNHEIDIRQYTGLAGLVGKPPIVKISDDLRKMEEHLGNLANTTARALSLIDVTRLSDDYRRFEKGKSESE